MARPPPLTEKYEILRKRLGFRTTLHMVEHLVDTALATTAPTPVALKRPRQQNGTGPTVTVKPPHRIMIRDMHNALARVWSMSRVEAFNHMVATARETFAPEHMVAKCLETAPNAFTSLPFVLDHPAYRQWRALAGNWREQRSMDVYERMVVTAWLAAGRPRKG